MNKILRIILFLLLLFWFAGLVSPVFIDHSSFITVFSPLIKKFYSPVCHQNLDKSIITGSIPFHVCARCTGIYTGAFLISLISLFYLKDFKLKFRTILLSGILMLADIILYSTGIYNYSRYAAFFTGLFFGSAVFLYILTILENILARKNNYDLQE